MTAAQTAGPLCGQCFALAVVDGACIACGTPSRQTAASVALPVGTKIGDQYLTGDVLGMPGGFGIAYIGWEPDLRRRVVIKELFPERLVTRQPGTLKVQVQRRVLEQHFALQRRQFLEEARRLAQLEAVPAVVRVLRYFEEHGTAYFVMPHVSGRSLGEAVRKWGSIEPGRLLQLLWPLLEGLKAVHEAGVLHLDIKPENVLIDEQDRMVLIDFGSAAAIGSADEDHPMPTSPHFASPEQYANDHRRLGAHTDLYAVGALMYFALTGSRPLDAQERLRGAKLPELRSAKSALPGALVDAIKQCLHLDATGRPASAAQLLEMLEPLRPAHHWADLLPEVEVGRRLRRVHALVAAGRSLPVSLNPKAAALQWIWLFAAKLPATAAMLALLQLGLMGAALLAGLSWDAVPLLLLVAWVLGIVPCAAFADVLLYRRVSAVGASLGVATAVQRGEAARRLATECQASASGLAQSLGVPVAAALVVLAIMRHQHSVRDDIAGAIDLAPLRARVVQYQTEHPEEPLPSNAQLDFRHSPDAELRDVQVVAGSVEVTLASSPVAGRRIRWRQNPDGSGNWICEPLDLQPQYIPRGCAAAGTGR